MRIYRLIAKVRTRPSVATLNAMQGTLEEAILDLQLSKNVLAKDVIGAAPTPKAPGQRTAGAPDFDIMELARAFEKQLAVCGI